MRYPHGSTNNNKDNGRFWYLDPKKTVRSCTRIEDAFPKKVEMMDLKVLQISTMIAKDQKTRIVVNTCL